MLAAELVHDLGREDPGGEGSSEDGVELSVKYPDAHLGKVPVGVDDLGSLDLGVGCQSDVVR